MVKSLGKSMMFIKWPWRAFDSCQSHTYIYPGYKRDIHANLLSTLRELLLTKIL